MLCYVIHYYIWDLDKTKSIGDKGFSSCFYSFVRYRYIGIDVDTFKRR